jgi:hypothetical protein
MKYKALKHFIAPLVVAAVFVLGLSGDFLEFIGSIALFIMGDYVGVLLVDKDLLEE